jgi:sodium transport system permease protein
VFSKEVRDNLRDRRSIASALVYPMLGPVLLIVIFTVMGRQITEQTEAQLELPVLGADRAPALVAFLRQQGVRIVDAPDDPEAAVRAGDLDVVLEVPEGYAEAFSSGRPATVRLVVDESRQVAGVIVGRTRGLLDAYAGLTAAQRLLLRGVSPEVIRPLMVETADVSTPQAQAANFLGMLPYFLVFSVFIGGMYLAIDSTAGERERGSLEPLLMNPVSRDELVLGKLAAVLVFTLIAVVETILAFGLVLNVVPLEDLVGVRMGFSPAAMLATLLIVIPMMPLAGALQIIIASYTRSFKEAQNYLSLLPLVPALPGLLLMFTPVKLQPWHMIIPTFGQQLLINQVMRGEPVRWTFAALSAAVTLAASAAMIAVAIRLYRGEAILFGRRPRTRGAVGTRGR